MAKKDLNIMPATLDDGFPIAKKLQYFKTWVAGDHHKLARAIIQYLTYFDDHHYEVIGGRDIARLDDFISAATAVVTDPRFQPNEMDSRILAAGGHLFSNLVASSSYLTTERALRHVMRQDKNFTKVLFLLNSRCDSYIAPKVLFDIDPAAATCWYTSYVLGTSNPTKLQQANLTRHLELIDDRYVPSNQQFSALYFTTTYFAPDQDRRVKGVLNAACRKRVNLTVTNNPDPTRIAIVTAKWHRNHAVYKSASPLLDQLKGKYKLDLIHLGPSRPENLVTEGFENVYYSEFKDRNIIMPPEVLDNDYCAAYYPDIGMNDESMWLSNARLAPVQVMGYGHPATSGDGSQIDYFIGGDIEKDVTDRYSETMVLIPGLAQHPAWPSYTRKNNWAPNDKVVINCVWGPDKYNYSMLSVLAKISATATTEHEWHMYPSPGVHRYGGFVPFKRDILTVLPNAVIHSDKEYYEYMESAEKGDFTVNSFPFGGYNTVVESLFLGLPIVALEGDRFYNRAASYLLRKIGMEDLNADNPLRFIDRCVRMIDDESYRTTCRERLAAIDLRERLFEDPGTYFLQAFDYILANHPFNETAIIGESV